MAGRRNWNLTQSAVIRMQIILYRADASPARQSSPTTAHKLRTRSSSADYPGVAENYWGKNAIEVRFAECGHTRWIPLGHSANHFEWPRPINEARPDRKKKGHLAPLVHPTLQDKSAIWQKLRKRKKQHGSEGCGKR